MGKLRLKIPNYSIRTIFWEYFSRMIKESFNLKVSSQEQNEAVWQLAYHGEIKPYINYVSERIVSRLSNRDLQNFNEKYVKVILLA
jgi:hypothetical protein